MKPYKYSELKKSKNLKDFATGFAPLTDLAADKIDAINQTFGIAKKSKDTYENLDELIEYALETLKRKKTARAETGTGRVFVEMWVDERDEIKLKISYDIVEV